MKLRLKRYIVLVSLFLPLIVCRGAGDKRPNIVVILVDDMGFSDIGCYGSEIATPNIDRLAQQGLRFTRFYNTAKCFPSRACLLTGQYAQHVGMSEKPLAFKNAATIAEILRSAGYRTLMTGKHHGEENPRQFGFDRYYGLMDGACNYFNPGQRRSGEPAPASKKGDFATRKWAIDDNEYEPYTPPEKDFYTTDYFTNYALRYLDEYKGEGKPFFLYLAYNAPHEPLMAWPSDIKKYLGKYLVGYEAIRKRRYERQLELGLWDKTFSLSAPTYEKWDALSAEEKTARDAIMATYAAMIDRVDQNIGRLLRKLEELHELDNTLIFFMSDNGAQAVADPNVWLWARGKDSDPNEPIGSVGRFTSFNLSWANVSNTPFRYYKAYSHEGGIATPLIVWGKRQISQPGSITNFPAHLIDILPTILQITGARYPAKNAKNELVNPLDGISLAPLLEGRRPAENRPLFWQWAKGMAIRKGQWKLVSDDYEPWELYDFPRDQTENDDVVDEYPQIARELKRDWEQWIGPLKPSPSQAKSGKRASVTREP
ncbi:MAG: arylsulfatase [Opitutaceae bacterium]|nr:arylsulfatase [Opitutaceae bacterium]